MVVGGLNQSIVQIPKSIPANLQTNVGGSRVLANQILVSQFRTGTILTQYSLDSYGNATAVASGKSLLKSSTYTVGQPIIGFGVNSPSSGPGTYDWTGLDKRIGSSGVTNGVNEVVLNANGVPGWMRNEPDFGTAPDGSLYIEHAPLPEHYGDFGDLVAATVQRYPNIKYVHVWSEMKGFFLSAQNRWDYASYTSMYNQVYNKVKAVRSDVKVGGPYPTITSSSKSGRSYNSTVLTGPWGWADKRDMDVVTYWLQHKAGADFIAIDMKNHHDYDDEKITQTQPAPIPELVDRFAQNDKFIATVNWIRSLNNSTYPGATSLPIWFAEWYSRWNTPDQTKTVAQQTNQGTEAQRAAVMADGLIKMVRSGAQRAFLWGPQGEAGTNGWMHPLGLFTNTRVSGGGQATPFYTVQKAIYDNFSAGTSIVDTTGSNGNVTMLASPSKLLLVNTTGSSQTTAVLGVNFTLGAYEVALKDVPAQAAQQGSGGTSDSGGTSGGQSSGQQAGSTNASSGQSAETTQATESPAITSKIAGAFLDNSPIKIGSVKIPAKLLRFTSLAVFMVSAAGLIILERRKIMQILKSAWQLMPFNKRGSGPPANPHIVHSSF